MIYTSIENMVDTTVTTLGYYKARGLAQPIKILLKYAGVEFTDKYYGNLNAKNVDEIKAEWFNAKFTLGLDFPNVPYYIDGAVKLSQSTAIMRHLARKHGLVATDETGLIRQDLVEQLVVDIRNGWTRCPGFWVPVSGLPLQRFRLFSPDTVDKYQNLIKFLSCFESLPAIKAYMKSPEFIIGYYKTRGRGQSIRLMLKYVGVKFTNKYYDNCYGGTAEEMLKGDWYKVRFTMGLDFPNVPYYMDGAVKLTHSIAIMRHLARKHGLVATDETGLTRQDVLEQQVMDIRAPFGNLLCSKDFKTEKVKYLAETLPQQLDSLSRFLGTRQWFTGNHINYVDFLAYELMDRFRVFSPETVDKYQNLVQLLTRFEIGHSLDQRLSGGYFKVRGLAQPIRLLLKYAGVKFTDKYYSMGSTSEEAIKEDWANKKFTLGLDFPNRPYYIDGSVKLTQSTAIMRHLARKHGLVATDETGLTRQDVFEQQLADIKSGYIKVVHSKDVETEKAKYVAEVLPQQLDSLSRFLGTRLWFTGNHINYVDFLAYEILFRFRQLSAENVDKHQNLVQLYNRFESLPAIKAYINSPENGTGQEFTGFTSCFWETTLGLDFPNRPYYIDDTVKLSQSTAIMRHLARKHGLVATDETGLVRQDVLEQQLVDIKSGYFRALKSKDDETERVGNYLPQHLDSLSRFLGTRQWFTGNHINYVDFLAFEILFRFRQLNAENVDKYQNLVQFVIRFESYFNTRALGQPIRLLLKYKGVNFNDKYYGNPDADCMETFKGNWFDVKFTLGFDFSNVPYYIDGSMKLTQSNAILRYLARKHGLVATDETGLVRQDVVEQQLVDIRNGFFGVVVAPDFETKKVIYIAETLTQQLDALSRFLGTRQWFTGNHINYVDFLAYELLDWFRLFSPETVDKYQNLVQLLTRFESLPAIKAYIKSPEFISWPLFAPIANWGFKNIKIRGYAQPIRLVLKYAGVKFTDKYHENADTTKLDEYMVPWFQVKFTLGLDFPNVPYYMDGDVKITQSNAIMRHLARKHGLVATDETGLTRQDVLEQQFMDISNGFTYGLMMSKGYDTEKVKYLAETLPQQLDALSRFLGTRQWFTGNHINYVDFLAYELLDWLRLFSPET
ncbi:unnamed protein product, partial [Medioppia subpectinata]